MAKLRFARLSARKARQVVSLIKGQKVDTALSILANLNKGACRTIDKLLRSAISNAKRFPTVREENLYISRFIADEGPMMKRYRAQAMGRASMIRHRTCHLLLELESKEELDKPDQPKKMSENVDKKKKAAEKVSLEEGKVKEKTRPLREKRAAKKEKSKVK